MVENLLQEQEWIVVLMGSSNVGIVRLSIYRKASVDKVDTFSKDCSLESKGLSCTTTVP